MSVRPSPDMSAVKMVSRAVGEDDRWALLLVPAGRAPAARCRSRPSPPARRSTVNRPSSVIRMSASPSPVTSMNLTFGSDQSSSGSAANAAAARTSRPRSARRSRDRARPGRPRPTGLGPLRRTAVAIRQLDPGLLAARAGRLDLDERLLELTRLPFGLQRQLDQRQQRGRGRKAAGDDVVAADPGALRRRRRRPPPRPSATRRAPRSACSETAPGPRRRG